MSRLYVLHFHLADSPETIDLSDVRRNHLAMEFAELVVEFDLGDDIAIFADPDAFLGEDFAFLLGSRFDDVVIETICRFFAQELVRIFIDIALADIIVCEVGAHEVIGLGALSADAAGFLQSREIEPLVVFLVDVIVVHGQETRAFHIIRVKEEHDGLGIFAHVHCIRSNLADTGVTALVHELHFHRGRARVAIRAVLDLDHDVTGIRLSHGHCTESDNERRSN